MENRTVLKSRLAAVRVTASTVSLSLPGAQTATLPDLLAGYVAKAAAPASPARGETFFAQLGPGPVSPG